MNQIQIQEKQQERQQRMLDKDNFLVANKKVRRSSCTESRNTWIVSSYSQPKKLWYVVRYHDDINTFSCGCKSFIYSRDICCLHVLAVAIFEGGRPL